MHRPYHVGQSTSHSKRGAVLFLLPLLNLSLSRAAEGLPDAMATDTKPAVS